jgi:hypothetical protein
VGIWKKPHWKTVASPSYGNSANKGDVLGFWGWCANAKSQNVQTGTLDKDASINDEPLGKNSDGIQGLVILTVLELARVEHYFNAFP